MSQQWSITEPTSLPLTDVDIHDLRVELVAGRIDVIAHEETDGAHIEVTEVVGAPVMIDLGNGALRIRQLNDEDAGFLGNLIGNSRRNRSARVSVAVPATCSVQLGSVSASILASGTRSGGRITTVSGDVTVDGLTGDLTISSTSGSVDAEQLDGTLRVKNVSGQVTALRSRLSEISVNTVSGNLILDLTSNTAQVSSKSVSGDVTVRVPAGGGWDVGIKSVSGDAVVDGQSIVRRGAGSSSGHASEGDGALRITAKSVSGNVVLLRQKSERPGAPATAATDYDPDKDAS